MVFLKEKTALQYAQNARAEPLHTISLPVALGAFLSYICILYKKLVKKSTS